MANPWFRLYSEFAHDPKIQMMPEAMQRRYVMLLCLRCSNDLVTLHETELAFHLRISDADLAETKALFIAKKFIDDDWALLNWDKRQFRSDSSTERVTRHRASKKEAGNADVTLQKRQCNALDTDTDTDTDTDMSAGAEDQESELPLPSPSSQNPPQPQNSRSAPKERIPAKPKRAKAKRPLPDDWGLDPRGPEVAYALTKGMKIDDVRAEAENFRNHHRAKGNEMADWNAAWRTWAGNWQKYNGKGASNGRQNYPNNASKHDRIEDALAAAKLEIAERWVESARADAAGGTVDGRLHDDEHFRSDAGIIDGDYTVVSD